MKWLNILSPILYAVALCMIFKLHTIIQMINNIFANTDVGAILGYMGSAIAIITFIYRALSSYHNKIMSEIKVNRVENEKLSNEIKSDLNDHSIKDLSQFDTIGNDLRQMREMMFRNDTKIDLLVQDKIKK